MSGARRSPHRLGRRRRRAARARRPACDRQLRDQLARAARVSDADPPRLADRDRDPRPDRLGRSSLYGLLIVIGSALAGPSRIATGVPARGRTDPQRTRRADLGRSSRSSGCSSSSGAATHALRTWSGILLIGGAARRAASTCSAQPDAAWSSRTPAPTARDSLGARMAATAASAAQAGTAHKPRRPRRPRVDRRGARPARRAPDKGAITARGVRAGEEAALLTEPSAPARLAHYAGRLDLDPAVAGGALERLEVPLVLVGVGRRERRERSVERVSLAEVLRDRDPVARAGVSASERPAAEPARRCTSAAGRIVSRSAETFQSQSWRQ